MAVERILVIDDEELVRHFIAETLRERGCEVVTASCGEEGVKRYKAEPFDLVVTDMKMDDLTGIDVIRQIKRIEEKAVVIVITAHGSIENAVEAMHAGAFHYLMKPFSAEAIELAFNQAESHLSLLRENCFLRSEVTKKASDGGFRLIAESPEMKTLLQNVTRIAQSSANVFITGESGTGKEVVAQAIHEQSPRKNAPFVRINCAAVPETLIESEFFGHEKGAFTGANERRIGRFEFADGGTLLLDEVTEIPLSVQAKLLRAIQERVFERVGGNRSIRVDVRIIATSNRKIEEAFSENVLREDLYYRLHVLPVEIPPLRARPKDIIPLAKYFLEKVSLGNQKGSPKLLESAEKKLLTYSWPGNVRELANVIERSVVMGSGKAIGPEQLLIDPHQEKAISKRLPVGVSLKELEKMMILETLWAHQNNRKQAAKTLGITARNLTNKLSEYGVKTRHPS